MKTILIKGYYGVKNLGDDLILNAIVSTIDKQLPDYRIFVSGGVLRSKNL